MGLGLSARLPVANRIQRARLFVPQAARYSRFVNERRRAPWRTTTTIGPCENCSVTVTSAPRWSAPTSSTGVRPVSVARPTGCSWHDLEDSES